MKLLTIKVSLKLIKNNINNFGFFLKFDLNFRDIHWNKIHKKIACLEWKAFIHMCVWQQILWQGLHTLIQQVLTIIAGEIIDIYNEVKKWEAQTAHIVPKFYS